MKAEVIENHLHTDALDMDTKYELYLNGKSYFMMFQEEGDDIICLLATLPEPKKISKDEEFEQLINEPHKFV